VPTSPPIEGSSRSSTGAASAGPIDTAVAAGWCWGMLAVTVAGPSGRPFSANVPSVAERVRPTTRPWRR
jgi:hypothetical protein